jgi:hypothetical protein
MSEPKLINVYACVPHRRNAKMIISGIRARQRQQSRIPIADVHVPTAALPAHGGREEATREERVDSNTSLEFGFLPSARACVSA